MRSSSWVLIVVGCLVGCGGSATLDLQRSAFSVDRSSGVIADGKDAATATVHLIGSDGKAMRGVSVSLSVDNGAVVAPAALITDANGDAKAMVTSTLAGAKTLSATATQAGKSATVGSAQITFVAGPPDASKSSLTAPASGHAGDSLPVSVQLVDANGNPCSGQAVSLSASGSGSLTPASGVTAADGTLSATLTDSQVETVTVTALTAAFQLTAQAQFVAPAWKAMGPANGDLVSITPDPTNASVAYALTQKAGVFKTVDGGAHWFPINTGLTSFLFKDLVLDPSQPDHLFVAGTDGGFASSDGGASWTALDSRVYGAIAVDPTQPGVLYAGSLQYGVLKSVDGGKSWAVGSGGIGVAQGIAVDPHSPSDVYMLNEQGLVYLSIDAGSTWTSVSGGLPTTGWIMRLILVPTSPATLYLCNGSNNWRSTNGGSTWQSLSDVSASASWIAADPKNPQTLFAVGAGLSLSVDGGSSWTSVTSAPAGLVTAAVSPLDSNTLWVGGTHGIQVSSDKGTHWGSAGAGLYARSVDELIADPNLPKTLMAVTHDDGVLQSSDSGATWSSFGGSGLVGTAIQVAAEAGVLDAYDVLTDNGVYRSDGWTWTQLGSGFPSSNWAWGYNGHLVEALDGTVFVSGWGEGVYRLTSSSGTWEAANNGLTDLSVNEIVADPRNASVLYAATQSGLFKTTDGATSWTQLNVNQNPAIAHVAVSPSNPSTLYIVELAGAMMRSDDGGATWTEVRGDSASYQDALAVDPTDPNTVYLVVRGEGVFKSVDGGNTWAAKNSGLWLPAASSIAIDPSTPSNVYLGTGGGVFATTTAGE